MLSFIPENERNELSQLLVVVFYPSWPGDVAERLAIRKNAISWIRSYRKNSPFEHSEAINLVLNSILTQGWLKKEVRNYSIGISDPNRSLSQVAQARSDLLSLTDQIYQYATSDDGLSGLKMIRY